MIIKKFNDFPTVGCILGIDWGMKRIGIAISSPCQNFTFVRPEIIETTEEKQINNILYIVNNENIKGIIVGLPLRINGEESLTTKNVKKFVKHLTSKTIIPILFIEEYLTSFEAKENKKKGLLDSESARIILENGISLIRRNL